VLFLHAQVRAILAMGSGVYSRRQLEARIEILPHRSRTGRKS